MNGGGDHAAHYRGGDRLHHVRADAGFPEDRHQTREHGRYRHQLGAQALHGTVDHRRLQVRLGDRSASPEALIQRLMQIDDHHDTGLNGNAEERDVADPNGHAEVIAKPPLQQQTAGKRIDRRKDQHQRLSHGMKDEIEQHEDDEEDDGKDQLQPFLRAQLKFVFAGPLKRIVRGQLQLLL